MQLNFTKMHGLGNDFVVINAINQTINLSEKQIRFIADRRFGIGCDQVLLVESTQQKETDFRYRIYNADGGEVEQCGNGARCFATFVRQQGLTDQKKISVITASGKITLHLEDNEQVSVNMGSPILLPEAIPFVAKKQKDQYDITISGSIIPISVVSMGNPHAVIIVDDIQTAAVETLGPLVQQSKYFPNQANIGFMQIINKNHIKLRVYERGSGETLACGTGACAAMVAGQLQGLLDDSVKVSLPGGDLLIRWAGGDNPVMMTGPTATVFTGSITI
ncbi:MAG TPA: diaminopimelate epimerase [Leucothrix mucor]|uniref:Diaminopimelate epimerase n=1 Tax=Leucothrix mucor TaxID=45248 RepID=A0A7V2T1X6_LEUMU|nr:diaminopimelate epimerase [Leucothrix mucor]